MIHRSIIIFFSDASEESLENEMGNYDFHEGFYILVYTLIYIEFYIRSGIIMIWFDNTFKISAV